MEQKKNTGLKAKFTLISLILLTLTVIIYSGTMPASATKVSTTGLCSQESQTIMRISSATNAHGEIWNNVPRNYDEAVCYNTIFGSLYTGSSPQACTGSNKIVGLSSMTNAHAEKPSLSNYATAVCYGNLVCTARSSCLAGEKEVVSLSSDTNAHLASDGSYSTKICCSSAAIINPCVPACTSGQTCINGQCVTGCTSSEAGLCNDGIDNDCDGEKDYDYDSALAMHGDSDCPLSVTAISVSDSNPGEYANIDVYCTSSIGGVNSIDAYIDSALCTWDSWAGDVAKFICNVGSYTGSAKTARCTVNTAKSYQSGSDATANINVLPSACSGYASSSSCDSDPTCDWCGECSGTKYSGGSDRCVNAGSCSYSCWKGQCGAGCDNTNGGWTNYVCDNYCSGGALYARGDITNSCQDDCTPTTNNCADGTATFCGTTSCASPAVGSCDNPCADAGTPTDGTDAACGTCTPTCISLGVVSWEDINNQAIQSAEINDSVRLIANGSELAGKSINFTVYKDGGGCGLLWLSDCEIAQLNTTAQSNYASTTWKIGSAGVLYFKASIDTGQETQSGDLIVYSAEDNSMPLVAITSPANGAGFMANAMISFNQSSSDEDDDISITWDFGDGNTTIFTNCLTGINCNTIHTYTTQGTKNVIVTAEDERGRTTSSWVSIDIFQGAETPLTNVFARISKPEPDQVIQGSGWVYFNASGSYAANCSTLPCTGCYQVGSLWCTNLDKNSLAFNWTFDDGTARYGTWQGNYSYAVEFNKFFAGAGTHSATLRAGYG